MSDGMELRRALADRVGKELPRHEQETGIQFFGDADHYEITTYVPTMVGSLLEHSHAEIEYVYVVPGHEQGGMVSDLSTLADSAQDNEIEDVCARLPLSTLTIKGSPRYSNRLSEIVNTPADAEAAAEAFE